MEGNSGVAVFFVPAVGAAEKCRDLLVGFVGALDAAVAGRIDYADAGGDDGDILSDPPRGSHFGEDNGLSRWHCGGSWSGGIRPEGWCWGHSEQGGRRQIGRGFV